MAKAVKEEAKIEEKEIQKTTETILEKIIVKEAEDVLDIYDRLKNTQQFSMFLNDFFKHYCSLGFKELNTLLKSDNCIKLLSNELKDVLRIYLYAFELNEKYSTRFNNSDRIRTLTNNLRDLYYFKLIVSQNSTLLFEDDINKWFAGSSYQLYAVRKDV
jgi:hypothetical protein